MRNIICLWSGAIVDIPAGWVICDGNNDTPDLRDAFVVGAGLLYAVDEEGGSVDHTHTFTSNTHKHTLGAGGDISVGGNFSDDTTEEVVTGTTDAEDNIPPYYALAYIMKT